MRNAVINELERLAKIDKRIVAMTADLGYSVFESYEAQFPQRFYNVGICEQFMTSAAAGMALSGDVVFTYSIGNFPTLRCIEQIRNDVCYHYANVKIIAVGGGFAYGQLGMSHHATEDIALMRALPAMRVLAPADPEEAVAAVDYAFATDGPCYIRLARRGEPVLYLKEKMFRITRIQELVSGTDVALLLYGPLLQEGLFAAKRLREHGVSAGVYSVPCIKPIDTETLNMLAVCYPLMVIVEEHQISGGLGSAVLECVGGCRDSRAAIYRLGLNDEYTSIVGSYSYLCNHYGLSGEKIFEAVMKRIDELNA